MMTHRNLIWMLKPSMNTEPSSISSIWMEVRTHAHAHTYTLTLSPPSPTHTYTCTHAHMHMAIMMIMTKMIGGDIDMEELVDLMTWMGTFNYKN